MCSIFAGPVRAAAGIFAVLAAFGAFPAQAQEWKTFTSDEGFSVQYPADWVTPGEAASYRLDIFNEAVDLNGATIKSGQAGIIALREPQARTAAEAMANDPDPPVILRQQDITSDIGDCRRVQEVVTRFDFVDPKEAPAGAVPQQDDTYYCETGGTALIVNVFYWADDKNQEKWRAIARKMVSTLRLKN